MLKRSFFYVAVALAFAACTNTDVIEENEASGAIIGFNSHVSNSTRALTMRNFNKFFVYGGYTPKDASDYHTVFNGVAVSKDADTNKWTKVPLSIEGSDNTIQAAKPAGSEGGEAVAAKELTTGTGFVLPVTYASADVYLNFKIEVKQGEDIIKTDYVRGNIQPTWALGTSYTYNITVNGSAAGVEKIEFSVDASNGLEEWTESTGGDFNFGS